MLHLLIAWGLAALRTGVGCATIPDTARIEALGRFSEMRYTEEHVYGHSVELWRVGACLFGLLEVSEGLAGDTPTGQLNDVRYDPRSGAMSFTAKLTTGVTRDQASNAWVPARDLFRFAGMLRGKVLEGTLRRSGQLRAEAKPIEKRVVLRLESEQATFPIEAPTYGERRKQVQPILQFRGPKW